MNSVSRRPAVNDYAAYYGRYISLVPDGEIVATLRIQAEQTTALLSSISEDRALYAYAPGKWAIKQVIGHVVDTERVFTYRALRIGRNDPTPLPGFEQDDYVAAGHFNTRPLSSLRDEFAAVRAATLELFSNFDEQDWQRRGTANGNEVTPLALAYINAGHELHHTTIIRTRYLGLM